MSITSYPSLTASWTPASSCLASTGFWYVVYGPNVIFSDMFGMPSVTNIGQKSSPTGGCVPPSYTLSVPYLTDGGCPSHYFAACSTATSYSGQSADYIMCCPSASGWNFNCAAANVATVAPYGCQAILTSGAIITGSRTDLVSKTGQAETHTVAGDTGVNAWGIALLSTPPMTSSSTMKATSTSATGMTTSTTKSTSTGTSTGTSTSTGAGAGVDSSADTSASTSTISSLASTSTPTSSTKSLSNGAAAGIGVGVGIVGLAILGSLFWFLRRKHIARQGQPSTTHNYQNEDQVTQNIYYDPSVSQNMLPNGEWKYQQQVQANFPNHSRPSELDDNVVHRHEMEG